jgi:hypothetical protein
MDPSYEIELTIHLPDGGRLARKLLNLYAENLPEDILAAAAQLCDGNEAVQRRKFGNLVLKRMEVWSNQAHHLRMFVLLSVQGDDKAFLEEVITRYMECFPGNLKRVRGVYLGSADSLPDISLQPTEWAVAIR